MEKRKFDIVDFVMDYESGLASEVEIVEGFQHMINSGAVWGLQGSYGSMAHRLIELGFCKDDKSWTPSDARKALEDYVNRQQ